MAKSKFTKLSKPDEIAIINAIRTRGYQDEIEALEVDIAASMDAKGWAIKPSNMFTPPLIGKDLKNTKRRLIRLRIRDEKDFGMIRNRARDKLVLANEYLVGFALNKWYRRIPNTLYEDMKQEGLIGVGKAIDKFDLEVGVRFATYATWWIRQSINQYLAETGRTVRAPAYVIGAAAKIAKAKANFEGEFGRLPTDKELSKLTEIPIKKLAVFQLAMQATASLEFAVGEDTTLGELTKDENSEDPADAYLRKNITSKLSIVLSQILLPREEFIIRSRFGLAMVEGMQTLEQIGERLHLTKERVRQIEKKAMGKLTNSGVLKTFVEENY